jgi:hypothetical protein
MPRIDDRRFKGLPLGSCLPVSRVGDLGWNALRDLEYPVLLLHQNSRVTTSPRWPTMAGHHRVELAPHAKTTVSP